MKSEFERIQNPPTSKDAAKEQLLLRIKDLTKEYRVVRSNKHRIEVGCKNSECTLNIGYYESKEGWIKIKKWCETHTTDCSFTTPMRTLPRPLVNRAVEIAVESGDIGYSDIKLIAKSVYGEYELDDEMRRVLKNSKYEVLDRHSLTGPKFEGNIEKWYEGLEGRGYTVDRRDIGGGGGAVRILVPHYEAIITAFHSPLFLDGTFSSNGTTLIHASAVTSSNRVLLVGIAVVPSESSEAVSFLMAPILRIGPTHCDGRRGESNQKGARYVQGGVHSHAVHVPSVAPAAQEEV